MDKEIAICTYYAKLLCQFVTPDVILTADKPTKSQDVE